MVPAFIRQHLLGMTACLMALVLSPASVTASDLLITPEGYEIGTGQIVALLTPDGQGGALRAGPGEGYAVLMQIDEDEPIVFMRLQDDWALIRHFDSDTEGWVPRSHVDLPRESGAVLPVRILAPEPEGLALRAGPGEDQPELGRLPHGLEVEPVDSAGDWLEVLSEAGIRGWIPAAATSPVYCGPARCPFETEETD